MIDAIEIERMNQVGMNYKEGPFYYCNRIIRPGLLISLMLVSDAGESFGSFPTHCIVA